MASAALLAGLFTPSASLHNAPEDILGHILTMVSPLDVLSIRRCCRRLYHVSNAKFVWIDALRKVYSRRGLPPLCPPGVTSKLPSIYIEHRATRPWRFLHALADIASAPYDDTFIELEERLAPPLPALDEEALFKGGVIGVYLIPGGRWLYFLFNTPRGQEDTQAVLIIIDLWRDRTVLRHQFVDSAHWAHVQVGTSGLDAVIIVGFGGAHILAPYFSAFRVAIFQLETEAVVLDCIASLKVDMTPRSCSVFGNVLASADRTGRVILWDWHDQAVATVIIRGWPQFKGKIMLISNQYFASFNPWSSSFAIHGVPPLQPLRDVRDAPTPEVRGAEGKDQGRPMPHALPPIGPPSVGLKRFRLPSRSLTITAPERVPALSFFHDNSPFPDPFSAYFLFSHQDTKSDLYVGLIPEILSAKILAVDAGGPLENPAQDPDEITAFPLEPAMQDQEQHASWPAPEWLSVWRCVDTKSNAAFSHGGRILWSSSLDHSIAVLKTSADGRLELFTTSALHSKPVVPRQTPTPRHTVSRHYHQQNRLYLHQGHMHLRSLWPRLPPTVLPAAASAHSFQASSSQARVVGTTSTTSFERTFRDVSGPSGSASSRQGAWSSGSSLPLDPPRSYSSTANPHPRIGRFMEGDYQVIGYHPRGTVRAATVDDVSGKIAVVIGDDENVRIVVLDYGWNFWNQTANEELEWRIRSELSLHQIGNDGGY